jgi:transposase
MKLYRYIVLSKTDNIAVVNGAKFGDTHNFRERCRAILLSNRGQTVPQIAFFLEKRCETIRQWFDNWEKDGLDGLKIKPGRGLKPTLKISDESLVAEVKKKSKNNRLNS